MTDQVEIFATSEYQVFLKVTEEGRAIITQVWENEDPNQPDYIDGVLVPAKKLLEALKAWEKGAV